MPAHIQQERNGSISAFTSEGTLSMNFGSPMVAWSFAIKDLEDWLTTLEETMLKEENVSNRWVLERLYFTLKAAHSRHQREHHEIITDAPSEDDLMSYLAAYAGAVGSGS